MGNIFQSRSVQVSQSIQTDSITLGTVIATNDPQQMGRIKVLCPALGDDPDDDIGTNLPWATYVSPIGGMVNANFKRGANEGAATKGPMAYGMWGIPKIGTTVLICCIDGDPYYRVWMGAVFDQGVVNTLPHGRYFYQNYPGKPEGPFDAYEGIIEPLYSNLQAAFPNKENNYEWRTRGADFSVAGNNTEFVDLSPSDVVDETVQTPFTSNDGKTFDIKNGYATNRLEGESDKDESSVYSWTSPGFHSISMDDRPDNCKIKIRTTSGAHIIMDDTNERIYINTPQGNNWVEMDYNGNIDVHGRNLSMHADEDFNITADKTVRVYGKQGIHMYSKAEVNIQAVNDLNIKVGENIRTHAGQSVLTQAGQDTSIKAGTSAYMEAGSNVNIKAGADATVQAGTDASIRAGGFVKETGTKIYLNSTNAANVADPAIAPNEQPAKWTSRVPSHEPYPRVMTKDDFTHEPEVPYDDPSVGMVERGTPILRGKHWRR